MLRPIPNRPSIAGNRLLLIAVACIGILFLFAGKVVNLAVDYLWFKELVLTQVFFATIFAKIACAVAVGIFAFVAILTNIIIARAVSSRSPSYATFDDLALVRLFRALPIEKVALLLAALVVSFLLASWGTAFWNAWLQFTHAVPFGVKDPLFGKDVAFYVFTLPLLKSAYFFAVTVLVFSAAGAGLVYVLHGNIGFDGRKVLLVPGVRNHLLLLAGIFLCSLYFYFQYKMFAMVNAQNAIVNGAGFAQIKVGLPILGLMRYVSVLAAIAVWVSMAGRSLKPLITAALVVFAGDLAARGAVGLTQKFIVGPDELAKEAPFIAWSIERTRSAFGLDKMESRQFTPTADMTGDALSRNAATTDNIRLWDHAPLLRTFGQLQEIRTYYEFLDVDNDRYPINGRARQVMLSPRELVPSSLPSRMWINEHLTYTHGYGVCMGPVNSVTPEGLPDFFVKNIPPVSTIDLSVNRPQIYYGESDAGYAIVKTGAKEFDYPSGNENIYTVYDGTGGIRFGGLAKKLLFAAYFRELKILLRTDISAESRMMINRQILQRISRAVPFLRYDNDPYMVITNDGRLVWMIDGYTSTAAYPYAAHILSGGNYLRNSVKAVIDAYNGTIEFYLWDPTDPLIQTYARIFPRVFKPAESMPADLRAHVRYPQTLFSVQAQVYAVYHMTDPQVFYNKEDVWRFPRTGSGDESSETMKPYYTIMKLAGVGDKEEFILMIPFCPSKKENMIAWLAARCDDPNYGKLLVFEFPKQKLVYGPTQIESRINQDPDISKQLALWNQGDSRVIRGSLLVIPVEQSLIYVEPLYIASQSGGVPELKRVLVAYENRIAMEETLEKSLARIFGTAHAPAAGETVTASTSATASPSLPGDMRTLAAEADRAFAAAQRELRNGNWTGYGEEMRRVEELLKDIVKASEGK